MIVNRAGKTYGWRLISYDYVGTEHVIGVLNDLLREYHYMLLKCFESAQRTTDAELCVLLSKRRMAYQERFWLRNLYAILDHGNICGIEINQCFTW